MGPNPYDWYLYKKEEIGTQRQIHTEERQCEETQREGGHLRAEE